MHQEEITKRYHTAVDDFVAKLKGDPNIIAVFLCGSLAYDKVWEKSDVDMCVVLRDQAIGTKSYCIDEDDILINVGLITLTDFKKNMNRSKGGGMGHSMWSVGKFLYLVDESLQGMLDDFRHMGTDDAQMVFFEYTNSIIWAMEKIEKWLVVKNNPEYAQFYITKAADIIALMKLVQLGIVPTRESILQLQETLPGFIDPFYSVPLSRKLSVDEIYKTLALMENFLVENLDFISEPVIQYMQGGEIRTVTELVKKFGVDSHGITHIFDFLVRHGIIEKVSQTIRITTGGRKCVEEIAYLYIPSYL